MKVLNYMAVFFLSFFFINSLYAGNNDYAVNKLKNYLRDVNQNVKQVQDPVEKRNILNASLEKIDKALLNVADIKSVSKEDVTSIKILRDKVSEKNDELNGLRGYKKVDDKDLNNFADFTLQDLEQADQFVTISVTTLLLIAIVLILILR